MKNRFGPHTCFDPLRLHYCALKLLKDEGSGPEETQSHSLYQLDIL